jgi:cysteinyl-tRNA synthetase
MVEGEKISKSLGNGIRVQELLEKGIPADAIRLHILESNYRSQSKFSEDSLQAAVSRLAGYKAMAAHVWQPVDVDGSVTSDAIEKCQQAVLEALQEDLNTPKALSALSSLEGAIDNGGINTGSQEALRSFLDWLESALGLRLQVPDLNDAQKTLLAERETAREQKDWTKSDQLRDELTSKGIGLRDTATRAIWHWL